MYPLHPCSAASRDQGLAHLRLWREIVFSLGLEKGLWGQIFLYYSHRSAAAISGRRSSNVPGMLVELTAVEAGSLTTYQFEIVQGGLQPKLPAILVVRKRNSARE
jgi:hypothetical protein